MSSSYVASNYVLQSYPTVYFGSQLMSDITVHVHYKITESINLLKRIKKCLETGNGET